MNGTQIPKLVGAIVEHQGTFENILDVEAAQNAISNTREFIRVACEAWSKHTEREVAPADELAQWCRFYTEVFGMRKERAKSLYLTLPDNSLSLGWMVVIPKGFTLNQVFHVMQSKMTVSSYIGDDLDARVPVNDRTSETDYAIFIRDRIEADEENKNLSANQIATKGIKGMTLLERLLLELFYFWKKQTAGESDLDKMHLDVKNVTLCCGSRRSDGSVPCVSWGSDGREVYIDWCSPDGSDGSLRARAVQLAATSA